MLNTMKDLKGITTQLYDGDVIKAEYEDGTKIEIEVVGGQGSTKNPRPDREYWLVKDGEKKKLEGSTELKAELLKTEKDSLKISC